MRRKTRGSRSSAPRGSSRGKRRRPGRRRRRPCRTTRRPTAKARSKGCDELGQDIADLHNQQSVLASHPYFGTRLQALLQQHEFAAQEFQRLQDDDIRRGGRGCARTSITCSIGSRTTSPPRKRKRTTSRRRTLDRPRAFRPAVCGRVGGQPSRSLIAVCARSRSCRVTTASGRPCVVVGDDDHAAAGFDEQRLAFADGLARARATAPASRRTGRFSCSAPRNSVRSEDAVEPSVFR